MPDLLDTIYDRFGGRKVSEFYERKLLDPAYRIFHKYSNRAETLNEAVVNTSFRGNKEVIYSS